MMTPHVGAGISDNSSQITKQSAVPGETATDGKNGQKSVTDHLTFLTFMRHFFSPGQTEEYVSPQAHM